MSLITYLTRIQLLGEDVIPLMARRAFDDHSTATNPRPLTVADYDTLLREALTGEPR